MPAAAAEIEHEVFDGGALVGTDQLVTDSDERRPLIRHGYWHLLPVLTRQQLRVKYSQSALQVAWNVIQPAALMGVYALFFNGVLDVGSDDAPYLSFIVAGLVPWRFVAASLSTASSLTDNVQLISKIYFPREIIPVVNTSVGLVDLGIGTVIMLVIVAVQGAAPSYHLVALPLVYLLVVLFAVAATIIVTTVAVFIRDVVHGMQLLLLGLFFATPIMYPTSQLPTWLQWFPDVNPLAVAVTQVRTVVLFGEWPEWGLLSVHLVIAAGFVGAALAYVRSVEHRMVDLA